MKTNLVDNALEYAARGWKIIPLHTMHGGCCSCGDVACTNATHPRIAEWQDHCSSDADQIRAWWQQWSTANIGLVTGEASKFFVLDIDPRRGGHVSLHDVVRRFGALPKTFSIRSSHAGYQVFFRSPSLIGSFYDILPGINVHGEGSYVSVPQDAHAAERICDAIVDVPGWLIKLIHVMSGENELSRTNLLMPEAIKTRRIDFDLNHALFDMRDINIFAWI